MNITGIAYIACFYVLVASGETLNGIDRTVFLNKRIGVVRAKRVSMLVWFANLFAHMLSLRPPDGD